MSKTFVVIPNWNGEDSISACLNSILDQSFKAHVVVVDNGSMDKSINIIENDFPGVEIIKNVSNKGFARAVNQGFNRAISLGADYVASFNNDAVGDKDFLKYLVSYLDENNRYGIATCKILNENGTKLDSTGDYLTVWGLPYPRGRGESDINKYDDTTDIFAASGGASLYRVSMLKEIGLFDEAFFAYYEDIDLSFRAQLAGWKIAFVRSAVAYHQIGATSSKLKGFATYQTLKNIPLLLAKNIPRKYIFKIGWRFMLARTLFFIRAITRGNGWHALKGEFVASFLVFDAYIQRKKIQANKKVSDEYIWNMMVHDLPPNAKALRNLRSKWWILRGKK